MRRLITILVALWAGSLWTVCGIVAPTLFAKLDDRHVAGQVAGTLFNIEMLIGVTIGAALLLFLRRALPSGARTLWLIGVTAGAPLVAQVGLRPMMEAARVANDMARFGMLHGLAAALFLAACLGALGLLWKVSRPAE